LITHADAEAGAAEVAHAMRVDLFDVSDCDFYLAGPARFVQTLAAELNAGGVPAAQISVQLMEAA
jgi:ferredoxin-NADP reductase